MIQINSDFTIGITEARRQWDFFQELEEEKQSLKNLKEKKPPVNPDSYIQQKYIP